jgi:hypothetical protein
MTIAERTATDFATLRQLLRTPTCDSHAGRRSDARTDSVITT